jgi:2-polyprenyl-3-methyl-5-hydroxy-6-metoxy-1,4-benzoquinol methylase
MEKEPTREAEGNFSPQWEKTFSESGEVFKELQENMPEVAERFKKEGVEDVLDLGCGAGRHSVYLAEQGFNVSGIDGSPSGVEIAQKRLKDENLKGDFKVGDVYERLPYQDDSL